MPTPSKLLSSADAAERLGISVLTLYEWLSQSDSGQFQIRGQRLFIEYSQGGAKGQGRIRISENEIDRLLGLMRVQPQAKKPRRSQSPKPKSHFITTPLGRPD
ncbi:helix-turn-helix domain-containing protein [Bremerella sp. TYQ1]|nr:helix-turn-helix domain-containing protein [Bremerella volcania]UBM36599.1 helix-turn-helix domain-containing protein [Bremerella volcania]